MTKPKPKYAAGDRFNNWEIVKIEFRRGTDTYVYRLKHKAVNRLLIVEESRIDDIFAPKSA